MTKCYKFWKIIQISFVSFMNGIADDSSLYSGYKRRVSKVVRWAKLIGCGLVILVAKELYVVGVRCL